MTEYMGEDCPPTDVSAGGNVTTVELARELVRLSDENEQLKKINDDLMVANDVLQCEVDRTAGATVLSPAVKARIKQVYEYTQDMEIERRGWGDEPMQDVHETHASFLRALITLLDATEVWCDGQGLGFGGNMQGIIFGMIPWEQRLSSDVHEFEHHPIEWTFHS